MEFRIPVLCESFALSGWEHMTLPSPTHIATPNTLEVFQILPTHFYMPRVAHTMRIISSRLHLMSGYLRVASFSSGVYIRLAMHFVIAESPDHVRFA